MPWLSKHNLNSHRSLDSKEEEKKPAEEAKNQGSRRKYETRGVDENPNKIAKIPESHTKMVSKGLVDQCSENRSGDKSEYSHKMQP